MSCATAGCLGSASASRTHTPLAYHHTFSIRHPEFQRLSDFRESSEFLAISKRWQLSTKQNTKGHQYNLCERHCGFHTKCGRERKKYLFKPFTKCRVDKKDQVLHKTNSYCREYLSESQLLDVPKQSLKVSFVEDYMWGFKDYSIFLGQWPRIF